MQAEIANMAYNQCSDSDDELVYGSGPGVELLKDSKTNTKEVNNLKDDLASLKEHVDDSDKAKDNRLEAQDERISSQEKDIEALKEASARFEAVRHRWVDTLRRDELQLPGLGWVPIGNKVAHNSDATSDARLFNLKQRND